LNELESFEKIKKNIETNPNKYKGKCDITRFKEAIFSKIDDLTN